MGNFILDEKSPQDIKWTCATDEETQMKKRKLTPGTVQVLLRRTSQIIVYSGLGVGYGVAFFNLPQWLWITIFPAIAGAIYMVFDYLYLIPQELDMFFDKTAGFIRMEEKLDKMEKNINELLRRVEGLGGGKTQGNLPQRRSR
jgi:hypothetical protein